MGSQHPELQNVGVNEWTEHSGFWRRRRNLCPWLPLAEDGSEGWHREGEAGETGSQGLMRVVSVTRKQPWPSLSPSPYPLYWSPWPPFPDYLFQWIFPDPLHVLTGIIWRWGLSFKVVTLEAATCCCCSKYCWRNLWEFPFLFVLVNLGCWNKMPQTGWLEQQTFINKALEDQNLRSRC